MREFPLWSLGHWVIGSLDIGHFQVGNQKDFANLAKLTNLANLEVHWSFPVHSPTVPQSHSPPDSLSASHPEFAEDWPRNLHEA